MYMYTVIERVHVHEHEQQTKMRNQSPGTVEYIFICTCIYAFRILVEQLETARMLYTHICTCIYT